jgi:5,10-methylenetetrahydrofolate reductase
MPSCALLDALAGDRPVVAAELRPPRAELDAKAGMDAWIDTYHAVRRLSREGTFVFVTDSAVGTREEDTIRHLVANLGPDAPRACVVPFLTSKHPLDYCLTYAERAAQHGFQALVVLGGDRRVGPPRCVEHAWQLRQIIRQRRPELVLGGWANPHADPRRQVEYLLAREFTGEFYLTQIVSHHDRAKVEAFTAEARRRGLRMPGLFGVFYYRSANPRTLAALRAFLPVPAEALTVEFERGASSVEVCARSLRALLEVGARHFYVSNLPVNRAQATLEAILACAGLDLPHQAGNPAL